MIKYCKFSGTFLTYQRRKLKN